MDTFEAIFKSYTPPLNGLIVLVALSLLGVLHKPLSEIAGALYKKFIKPDSFLVVVLVCVASSFAYYFSWLFIPAAFPMLAVVVMKVWWPGILQKTFKGVNTRKLLLWTSLAWLAFVYTGQQLWHIYRFCADQNKVIAIVLSPDLDESTSKITAKDVAGVLSDVRADTEHALSGVDSVEILPNDQLQLSPDDISKSLQAPPDTERFDELDKFRSRLLLPISFEITDRVSIGDEGLVRHQLRLWYFASGDQMLKISWPSKIQPTDGYFSKVHTNAEDERVALVATVAIVNYLIDSKLIAPDQIKNKKKIWDSIGKRFEFYLADYSELYRTEPLVAAVRNGRQCRDTNCVRQLARILSVESIPRKTSSTVPNLEKSLSARLETVTPAAVGATP